MPDILTALGGLVATPAMLGALLTGTLAGLLAGLTPGVSGRSGLMLMVPVAIGFGPTAGAVCLIAFHSVVHTSGSIPAILMGAPTSASEAATAIDGYAMARRGQAARAIGATLMASAFGGLVGAISLFLAVSPALALIGHVGAPEITALSSVGLLSIAALSGGRLSAGLMTTALGLLVASVGIDPFSSAPRFTFGLLTLWDGVSPAALVTGLLVIPDLTVRSTAESTPQTSATRLRDVVAGGMEVLQHRWLLLRGALIGVVVGLIPGLGASASVWIAYGHARQTHPSETPYGEGAIAGVIAPEAANNSKEGGSLIPTLFLGIPGSSGMGILLAAFATLGVEVGPRMLSKDPGFIFLMGWSNIGSNLLAVPLCLALAPAMARFASLQRRQVIPVALAAALAATAMTQPGISVLVQLVVFAGLGLVLRSADLPRAPLLLGFVLGPGLESGLIRSVMVYGWDGLLRPGVLIILALAASFSGVALWMRRRQVSPTIESSNWPKVPATAATALLCAAALCVAATLPITGAGIIVIASVLGLGTSVYLLVGAQKPPDAQDIPQTPDTPDLAILGLLLGAVAIAGLIGLPIALGGFVCLALVLYGGVGYPRAGLVALLAAGAVLGLKALQP